MSFSKRLGFAICGWRESFKSETSLRTQSILAMMALSVLIFFQAAPLWWALFALTIGMVVTAEMLNTALERLCDHLNPEFHEAIKSVKDIAAGAVLISSVTSVAVMLCFLWSVFFGSH